MSHPVTKREQEEMISACLSELGIQAHPNTVKAQILEAPGDRGHVVTVTNIRRGPLRVHVLLVAPDGEVTRVRYNHRV